VKEKEDGHQGRDVAANKYGNKSSRQQVGKPFHVNGGEAVSSNRGRRSDSWTDRAEINFLKKMDGLVRRRVTKPQRADAAHEARAVFLVARSLIRVKKDKKREGSKISRRKRAWPDLVGQNSRGSRAVQERHKQQSLQRSTRLERNEIPSGV